MAKRLQWLTGCIVFAIICMTPCVPAALAGSPTEAIKETVDKVFSILRDDGMPGQGKREEREALLRETIAARFDFREMAKRALGPHWKRNAMRQDQFASLFAELLAVVYLDTIEQGIKADVVYLGEDVDGAYASVDTRVVPAEGGSMRVRYQLFMAGGEWKAYDVLVEHMSIVQNYRSQFYHILLRHTFNELIEIMQKKIRNLKKSSRNAAGHFFARYLLS